MSKKTLPIPEDNRSDFGPGGEKDLNAKEASTDVNQEPSTRTGRQANIKVNTTNQGHQQDR